MKITHGADLRGDAGGIDVASLSLELPAWLPPDVRIVIEDLGTGSIRGMARVRSRSVARLIWELDGELLHEQPLDAKGKAHGLEIERRGGRGVWCAQWSHGKQHGLVIQFDDRGRPALVTRYVAGRGTDIWMSCGQVSEAREMLDGRPHGWARSGDPRYPHEEEHFYRGQRQGICRKWSDGELCSGYPRFYLLDQPVSRRSYEVAQARDPSLPRYDERGDSNRRPMPAVVRDALAQARQLRRELAILDQVRRATAVRCDGRGDG